MVGVDEAAVTDIDHRVVPFVNLTDNETMSHSH